VLVGVDGGGDMYGGLICSLVAVCSSFDFRFGISIVAFL
jgi:hypothetical protein